ncbi:MAG: hypothetical protein ABIH09_05500 [Candidatus Omnitrophota bacterium]
MFLKLSRAFTIDELEWLIELFHDKTLEMEMFGDKGLIDPYENLRPACAEAFNKLAWMIDRAIKLNPDLDFPKFDEKIILNQKGDNLALIGGVETLLMALEIQKGAGFFDPVAKKLLIFKPLRDEELKPVALLEKDIRNILEKDMVKHAKTIFKNLNTVSILRGYLGENSIIRSKKIRRDSFMFKGQAYDNEFYLKKAEEIKEGFFIIPCSTFYAGENHYYNVLVDARGENLEINVMNQEETEVIKTCLSNDFAESFERDPADREIMDNYLEHEEKIDKVIRDAIRRGDYSSLTAEEFEPLFNVRLKLHTILEQMLFGSDLNKAFQLHVMGKIMEQLKDITIINVGKKTNLPKITVKRPIKQDTDKRIEQEVTVRAHTGARGRYIFLTGREYAKLGQLDLNATNKELKSNIEKWIMHEFGIPLGLSDVTWDKEKGSLCNNFDDLYAEYENRIEFDSYDDLILSKQGQAKNKEITDFKVVAEELKKILMSREKNPIVDINNLRGINAAGLTYERDYAMAVFDNKLVKMLIAKFKWPEILKLKFLKISSAKYKTNFLEICRCFTEKTLERLVDIYDPEIFFFTERNIERDKECMRTLEAELRNRTKITNIRYDKFDRIKIDMIGGVQTLRDALLLKLHFGRWSIKSGTAELMSLPDEKLKAVALLQKDIWDIVSKHGDDLKNKIMKIERDPSSSYGRQYDSIFDFKKMKRNILGKDTILIPCHSLKENGIDYEKYYIMVSSLSKTKFRLSRNFKVLTKHEKEILEELYKSRIELDFQRPDEDKEDIFYYLQHERNIDNVIDDAIRNGRYTVISRSESTLLGDIYTTVRKIFDLFVPTKNREDLINKIMCRQYMLINVGDVKKLPQVELKIGSKKHQVIVRMHTGPRGKYIFLTNEEYSAYHTLKDKINSVQQKRTNSIITRSVVHDMGVPLGLTVWGVEDSEDGLFVLNDLDLAYKVWPKIEKDDERLDKTQFPELSVILKKENPLVDLNILSGTNAAGKRYKRDFIAGTVKERDPAIKEIWDKVDGTDNVKYLEALLAVLEKDKIAEIDMDQQVLLAGGGYFNFQVLKNRLENAGIKPVLENKIKFLKTKQKYQQEDICNNKMIKRWSEIKKSNALEKFKVYLKILENGNDAEYSHDEDILISPSRLPFDRKKIQAHLKDINAGPILRYKIKFLEMQQHLTKFKYQSGYIDLIPKVNRVLSAIDEDVESLVLNKIYDVLTNWEEGENLKEKQIYFNCRFKFNNLEDVERVFSFLFRQEAADLVKARLDLLAASSEEEIKCKECGETLEALNALENINDIGWIDTVMEMLEEHGEIKIDKNKKVNATEDGIENGIKPFLRYKSVYLKKTAKWKLEHEALLLDEIESMNDINKLEALLRIVTSQELESEDITLIRENFDTDDLLFMFDLPCVKDAIKERIENLNGGFQKKQFAKKEAAAIYVGEQIAPPESNYTLFVLNDFVTDGEYGEDQEDYGSRFGLERIGTTKPHEIVKDILGRIKELKESKKDFSSKNVIVQLPKEFAEKSEKYISHVEKLKEEAPGIQFIVVDTGQGAVKYAEGRKEYRRKIYTIMRLIKKLDEDISPELRADVDMFLRRFLKDCLLNVDGTTDSLYENYIDALAKNKIVDILKTILLYKPAEALPDPDLDKTVYMLTFA